jgi:hypothetical protein
LTCRGGPALNPPLQYEFYGYNHMSNNIISKIIWVSIFAVAMAYVESAVVVYLRIIFHPEGFEFPLKKIINDPHIVVEVYREAATVVMLTAFAVIAGKTFWERFGYFIIAFGVWDIFYYVWLKVILDWPASIFDWDVLFLIPVTWIGPVIAPVSVSIIMIVCGILLVYAGQKGNIFKPVFISYILLLAGTGILLFSFMSDTNATINLEMPKPYRYNLLIIGDALFIAAFLVSYVKTKK